MVKILLSWGLIQVILLFVAGILLACSVFWLIERKQNPDQFGGKPLKGMATGVYWVGSTLVSGICTGVFAAILPGDILDDLDTGGRLSRWCSHCVSRVDSHLSVSSAWYILTTQTASENAFGGC